MAAKAELIFVFCVALWCVCIAAPPSRNLFGSLDETSTSTQLIPEDDDGKNAIWDESDDMFDLDGDSWLNHPPSSLSTWSSQDRQESPDFVEDDDDDDENDTIIDDDDNEEIDEKDVGESNQSEFLLVPATGVDKRDLKVRHTGRASDDDDDLDDSNLEERPDDVSSDKEDESYDLISYPESDDVDDGGEDVEESDDDNDIFDERDGDNSKGMIEDRVFLF